MRIIILAEVYRQQSAAGFPHRGKPERYDGNFSGMASAILAEAKADQMTAKRPGHMSPIIRWEFTRGSQRISCQIDRHAERGTGTAFEVALVPFPNQPYPSIQKFDAVAPALRRHALLANALRADGWKLVAYTQ